MNTKLGKAIQSVYKEIPCLTCLVRPTCLEIEKVECGTEGILFCYGKVYCRSLNKWYDTRGIALRAFNIRSNWLSIRKRETILIRKMFLR